MCGIAGFFSVNRKVTIDHLKSMTDLMQTRGPDAEGFYHNEDNSCALGHRRLSVIDLSEASNQPMISSNGRYVIVFNGEIYNYREIARELTLDNTGKEKITLKTNGDTEVVLEAFSLYGSDFVKKLNGMFAFSIYDKVKNEIYLYRDRLGIKPLYYYWDGITLIYASELSPVKLLIDKLNLKVQLNHNAIQSFLHMGFIPAPYSIFSQINKATPGSMIKISSAGIEISEYWKLSEIIEEKREGQKEYSLTKLDDLIKSSVEYQLNSDVPYGVYLSGGIDSSLIAAISASLRTNKIETFSIGFNHKNYNESEYAKTVAKFIGTNHHEFIVSEKDAIQTMDKILSLYGEPFADSSALPTLLVSKLAKKHVTVALSGDGGDELFLGYGSYKWAKRLNNCFLRKLRQPIFVALHCSRNDKYQRASHLFHYQNYNSIQSHIFSQEQYLFSRNEVKKMAISNKNAFQKTNLNFLDLNWLKDLSLQPEEKQSLFDLTYYLPDDLLTKVDRASMAYSVEVRVPFLDHRIVEYAVNLDLNFKIRKGVQKFILKELLYQYIPKFYFTRPKQGFSIPLGVWLKKELKFLIDENLNKQVIDRFGIIKYNDVNQLLKNYMKGQHYFYNRIWLLIVLHHWLRKNS